MTLWNRLLRALFKVSRRPRSIVTAAAVGLVAVLLLAANPIGSPIAAATKAAGQTPPTYVWPEFHGNSNLTGLSGDPTFTTGNASKIGVKWMAPIGVGGSLESPMAQWDPTLHMTLAYIGSRTGNLDAINVANGQIIWSHYLGAPITSSPVIENGNVWTSAQDTHLIYKLNASTGATECSGPVNTSVLSTPVFATPPGGVPTVFFASIDWGTTNGLVSAFNESTCASEWSFQNYNQSGTGTWGPLDYTVDANGVGLLLTGTDNPDSSVYALNAVTGAEVWNYQSYSLDDEDWDIGAGIVTSAPGVNGFADGVAYELGKDGILNALDLTTGAPIWQFNFSGNAPGNPPVSLDSISTPGFNGTTLVFGDRTTLYAVNALTGKQEWSKPTTSGLLSSPIIAGPPGKQVVGYGDLAGIFHVLNLATGASLYSYQTGGYISSSTADVQHNFLIASSDGFLYDFGLNGGNGSTPTTTVTSPASGSTVPNPDGSLTITGTASAPDGVQAVNVQTEMNGTTGPWYHQSTNSFALGYGTAQATLASPGATSTTWSLTMPVPLQGEALAVTAEAVGSNGITDGTAFSYTPGNAIDQFTVAASPLAPQVSVSAPRVPPGGKVTISATGFKAGESVAFTAPTALGESSTLATVTANSTGAIPGKVVTIPSNTSFGADPITATGQSSGLIGYASVYVAFDSPQYGYNAQHTGQEMNDHVIDDYQPVDNSTKLSQQWGATGAGAYDTTPAISQGVVYIGDEGGTLSAFAETSGDTLFTVSLGSAIESSPAVDSGEVFVGDDGGNISAFNDTTGAPLWTDAIGGDVPTPTVYDGTVYVGSAAGDVYAINEVTGAIDWTSSVGGAVSSAPAINPGSGSIIATTQSGDVEALSPTKGAVLWSDSVGGALTGAVIYRSDVFVGSSNGSLYAINAKSGVSAWSEDTGAAITAAPIITLAGDVTVANAADNVSYYDDFSGSLINTQVLGVAITGLASTGNLVLASSPAGLRLLAAPYAPGQPWVYSGKDVPAFDSPGVFLNGDVFAAGADGTLRAFSTPGRGII